MIGDILHKLILGPLELLFDAVYTVSYRITGSPGGSIILLSIAVNLLLLPLFRRVDAVQQEERLQAQLLKPGIEKIRRVFRGDERFMIQSAYYRIEHYNPLSALKEAGPLLLQIPFFIAAYRYISSISVLKGASFGAIQDLLKPDGLLRIGGVAVNILPILMTAINIVSGVIYSKGGLLRQKIQIYGTALVFLVLLYKSPSGLVLYWIMNNLFSLCKNAYFSYKPKNGRVLPTVISILIIPLIFYGFFFGSIDSKTDLILAECILLCAFANILITVVQMKHIQLPSILTGTSGGSMCASLPRILIPELALTILFGFFIPSTVLSASPLEFIDSAAGTLQTELLFYPLLVYAGLFLIWMTVIVLSRDGKKRTVLTLMQWFLLGIALVNQFAFPAKTGTLYTDLTFDGELRFSMGMTVLNLLCCILVCGVLTLLYKKKSRILLSVGAVVSLSLLCLSLVNTYTFVNVAGKTSAALQSDDAADKPITLSRTGKNVVVMMLDRAIGGYVPYLFDELPELKDAFRGFVFYPNTISFGTHTNFGSPGLFGGYEYTPHESNKRDTVSLKDKQNEALKLMPALFLENGYEVTVCDPPCAGYQFIPDLSIFDELPGIRAYNLTGKFSGRFKESLNGDPALRQKRNFLMYSFFRTSLLFLKSSIYDNGSYMTLATSSNYTDRMIDAYSVLHFLRDITGIDDGGENRFLMLQNETPHNPTVLNPPDYAVDNGKTDFDDYSSRTLDGRTLKIETTRQWGHYCINAATYRAVAEWLEYLRQEGVYDNTRIILVADHGYYLSQFDDLIHPDGLDIESLNPLLMVKDFNADDPWTSSNEFMTNADVPTLAMDGIIENPVNPFTGNEVSDRLKHTEPLIVTDSDNWRMEVNNGTTFDLGGGHWWSVHDSIFDMANWELLD